MSWSSCKEIKPCLTLFHLLNLKKKFCWLRIAKPHLTYFSLSQTKQGLFINYVTQFEEFLIPCLLSINPSRKAIALMHLGNLNRQSYIIMLHN